MIYYDDILNVNAYLRSKMRKNLSDIQQLITDFDKLGKDYRGMLNQADDLLLQAQQIAVDMGVDMSDILADGTDQTDTVPKDCVQLLVQIPDDYDFSVEFKKLCQEAHEAGFTDVHPEELLSAEEMKHAEDFADALDRRFEEETGLTKKDMAILLIAVAVRVAAYYGFKYLESNKKIKLSAASVENELPMGKEMSTPKISASQGVDMGSVLKNARSFSETVYNSSDLIGKIVGHDTSMPYIRAESQILSGNIPFDIADNEFFDRSDILGYHPQVGWLFGVINILTNTVTTKDMISYSVMPSLQNPSICQVDQKLSTAMHVVYPVITNLTASKESLLAAVVREADALKMIKGSIDDVTSLLTNTMAAEAEKRILIDKAQILKDVLPFDGLNVFRDTAIASFINQLITAVHAIRYDPDKDGDVNMYAVRTNKILTISNGIAAMVNSMPVLISKDLSQLDFGGILTAGLSVFDSTRFWIEVKANYLVHEYKVEIDKEIGKINRYFL